MDNLINAILGLYSTGYLSYLEADKLFIIKNGIWNSIEIILGYKDYRFIIRVTENLEGLGNRTYHSIHIKDFESGDEVLKYQDLEDFLINSKPLIGYKLSKSTDQYYISYGTASDDYFIFLIIVLRCVCHYLSRIKWRELHSDGRIYRV